MFVMSICFEKGPNTSPPGKEAVFFPTFRRRGATSGYTVRYCFLSARAECYKWLHFCPFKPVERFKEAPLPSNF